MSLDITQAARRFLQQTEDPAVITRFDGTMIAGNPAMRRLIGRDPVGLHGSAIVHPDDLAAAERATRALARGTDSARVDLRIAAATGTWCSLDFSAIADRERGFVIGLGRDVTAARQADEVFRASFESAAIGMTITSLDGLWLRANDAFCTMVGRTRDELIGMSTQEMTHPDDVDGDIVARTEMLAGTRDRFLTEKRYLRPDGTEVWVSLAATVVRDGERPRFYITQIVDITEARAAQEALAASATELRMMAEHSSDMLSRHGPDGLCLYASPASVLLSGYAPEALVGRSWLDLVYEEDHAQLQEASLAFAESDTVRSTHRVRHADGRLLWWESTMRAVRDDDGVIREYVSVSRDVSERKRAEMALSHQALHDALTGLPNRALFLDRLGHALVRGMRRGGGSVAVLFLDVDRFKVVNDSLGHEAGDRLLVDVAARVDGALRPADTVARFGGDEFTVLCEDIAGEHEAVAIARRIVDLFAEPFVLEGQEVFLSTSIGIALNPPRSGKTRPDDLIRDADAAMYRAKESGKARFELFDAAMREHAVRRLALETELRRAVERGELRLHYQPEIAVENRRVVGFEALVRWEHPDRGLLAPADFIPLAEESGLVVELGTWVLQEACRVATAFEDRTLSMSVNVSARQVAQPDFVSIVRATLASSRLEPGRLCLELTESAVIENGSGTVATLQALKSLGLKLAIDDFGTGYSSLGHLRRFPIDVLKLDRSFVGGLGRVPQDASIAEAVISLAHALGLETVAEGIESGDQLRMLVAMGCDLGQGYLFARPGPAPVMVLPTA